ncbi:MAG: bifunctional phosphopantothenoylcysteine decarboxylase/phosphopantothenate--cysteine ligase CoaBC [Proteobacteria bacterium]|nr:bifunctional phosphopantothenoylcysteine decarboxylase/phosphopantothenate--cysteine ligase CoaBC [Pseudomonadota bacterium]MDA0896899.1 bifunctional phosphopantothenoylcysteine decarboxylase/phosphopantothenate--cysteine ligase CoaBC [Pseudomonadota bacterium]MDA1244392.1 bifunctional phosphopantothenoylcysteine decarboxylase/phosphopantothenate--cysteine ligase CoaBC [Pseudomonadota bacterium]
MLSLSNKRILLGITGGIAAYKCAELTRLFIKAGAEVRVVMTQSATEFITPLTLQALSGNRVHLDLLDPEAEAAMGHIELARWADLVLVAPATANSIARIAHGEANDILTTLVLATPAAIAIAPAMNQGMWSDAQTQANIAALAVRGYTLIGPGSGEQACGDVGLGRLSEPDEIVTACAALFDTGALAGRHIVITGGPTREALDPVRYISNHSSGKMAYALATEAAAAGARVTLISGPVTLATPERVTRVDVVSAQDMLAATLEVVGNSDVFIGVAAVADYRPEQIAEQKIKKAGDAITLSLVKNPDIIAEVASLTQRPTLVVGFAAETENVVANGQGKLAAKKLDLLFANQATDTFNSDSVAITAVDAAGVTELAVGNKHVVARKMLQLIAERLNK